MNDNDRSAKCDDTAAILFDAALRGDLVTVTSCIESGANIHVTNKGGYSIVTWVSTFGSVEDLVRLLSVIRFPDLPDKDDNTALVYAVMCSDSARATALLSAGARADRHIERDETTILHLALRTFRNPQLLRMFITSVADDGLTVTDELGLPPLFVAIDENNLFGAIELCRQMVDRNICLNQKFDWPEETARERANRIGRKEIAAVLAELADT